MACTLVDYHLLSTFYGSDTVLNARKMGMNEMCP